MITNGYDVPSDTTIETDVCIIGTGPAGLTLANELMNEKVGVVLLESGDLIDNDEIQSLNQGITGINPSYAPFMLRKRQLGGTANSWGIKIGPEEGCWRAAPLDEIDFESVTGRSHSGWPFGRVELDPFYQRSHRLCGLGSFDYGVSEWERPDGPQFRFPSGRLITTIFRFGRRQVFTEDCKDKVRRSSSLTCYYNSTAVELETDNLARAVERVTVSTLNGKRFWVKARTFVLAGGAIENTRLLLLSNRNSPAGLGNHNDLVGRFLMDHFMIHSGFVIPPHREIFDRAALYGIRTVDGTPVQGKLSFSADVLRKEQMGNSATYLIPRALTAHFRAWAIDSYKALSKSLRSGKIPPNAIGHLKNLGGGSRHIVNAVYRRITGKQVPFTWISSSGWADLPDKSKEFATFEVQHLIEQFPDPQNRMTLSEEKDKLGCRKVKVDNKLRDNDLSSIRKIQAILKTEFAEAGIGRLVVAPEPCPTNSTPEGSAHHLGTTRMHPDPNQGVVDANCKVHDVSNLYIASGSVFPTGGYANPTLTIIALAIRLADRLKQICLS